MPWPSYKSHKVIQASQIIGIEYAADGETVLAWVVADPPGVKSTAFPTEAAMAKRAQVGDYAVKYANDYVSVSPKSAFEDGYTEIKE